jgi:multidrug transporter EmrE-like cation transporter
LTNLNVDSSRLGIAFMILGMAMFTLNDALGKWLVADYAVGQLIAIRSLVALVLLLPLLWRRPDIWRRLPAQPGRHLLRVVLVAAEVSCFYWAVRYLPLAETFMFYLAAPIFVTALSVPLLGEQVGFYRWSAILVGFAGVMLILSPGVAAFSWPALIAIAGSMSLALMLILARTLGGSDGLTLITRRGRRPDAALRVDHATGAGPRPARPARRGGDRRALLPQSRGQAERAVAGGALPVHQHHLGVDPGLPRVGRPASVAGLDRRGNRHRQRAIHFRARARHEILDLRGIGLSGPPVEERRKLFPR